MNPASAVMTRSRPPSRRIHATWRASEVDDIGFCVMKGASPAKIWTDDELMALDSKDGRKHELWQGRIVTMSPAGAGHGDVIMRLAAELTAYVYEHRLGLVYDGQTGIRLSIDFCFCPDLSFVSHERRRMILPFKEKLFHGAPDLAVEVLSPS